MTKKVISYHIYNLNYRKRSERRSYERVKRLSNFESPFPCFVFWVEGLAKFRAQSAIEPVRPVQEAVVPLPPVRRSSSNSRGNVQRGVLVKRKSESQGGDVKRRRSSVTEAPRISSQQSPTTSKPTVSASTVANAKAKASLTVAKDSASSISKPASSPPKDISSSPTNGTAKGGLAGFDDYSESDSE
jgi:hypothetical protein